MALKNSFGELTPQNKKILIIALIVVLLVLGILYFLMKPKKTEDTVNTTYEIIPTYELNVSSSSSSSSSS